MHLDVGSPATARRAFRLLRELGVASELRTYRWPRLERATRFQLHVAGSGAALAVLREAGVLSARGAPLEAPPRRVVARVCCRGAYARGALLGAGSLSGGGRAHLEIRTVGAAGARFLAELAARSGGRLSVAERGGHAVAYAKGLDAIGRLLAVAGATDTLLALEERAVLTEMRSRANRLANADHANVVRATRAADAQLRAVARLDAEGRLGRLARPLQEAAELRRHHPALSLAELARRARPPVARATLHRRLARLVALAEESDRPSRRRHRRGTRLP